MAEEDQEILNYFALFHTQQKKIDRIKVEEYQVSIGADDLTVICYTSVNYKTGEKSYSLPADMRKRAITSYAVCSVIGNFIKGMEFGPDGSLIALLESGDVLEFLKEHNDENFQIVTEKLLPYIY